MTLDYAYLFDGEMYRSLLKSIPKGKYFDNRADIIPVEEVSEFRVVTEFVNEIHYVSVVCENGQNRDFTFVPTSKYYLLKVSLPKGLNTIVVYFDENNHCTKSFCCTYFGTMLYAYAKELNKATTRLDRLTRDIYKQASTRISAPVQQYASNLPEKYSLRMFGLQLITRALINSQGTFEALEDICKAVYVSTPKIEDVQAKNIFDLEFYSFAGQEYELGKIVYLWVRNPALVRRLYGEILSRNFNIPTIGTESTLENEEGFNEYDNSDESILVDDSGYSELDYGDDEDKPDGYLEIEQQLEIELPRLDRNLPIPFTDKYPWHDKNNQWSGADTAEDNYHDREHLDDNTSLDIASWRDPFNHGSLGKQYIPYRYDGSKVTSLIEVIKYTHISNHFETFNQNFFVEGYILNDSMTPGDNKICLENSDNDASIMRDEKQAVN